MDIREKIKKSPILMDGAMGTYFIKKTGKAGTLCEEASLTDPDMIQKIHLEYIEAGADVILTNTFSANRILFGGDEDHTSRVIKTGCRIAYDAVKESAKDVAVFGSIGPVPIIAEPEKCEEEYIWIAECMIEEGIRNFIFETMSSPDGLSAAAGYIKKYAPDSFIIASFALQSGGYTAEGYFGGDLISLFENDENIDIVGFNCGCSAAHMLENIFRMRRNGYLQNDYFSAMPNAGYPVIVNGRPLYQGDPDYFADRVIDMAAQGARIIGGCCGTTPEHIRKIRERLDLPVNIISSGYVKPSENAKSGISSAFWNGLISGKKVIAVEIDPPEDTDLTRFINGVREIRDAGADIITIADCPIGRARMDSSLLACKVQREEHIEAIPHMTCRDRNINATKALWMGLYAEGIRNVLLVTGDPVPNARKDEVKAVYQFNSRKLARFADSLNNIMFPDPIHFFGALNVNAPNFDIQLELAMEKEAAGIKGFLTQPVLTPQAFENLKKARDHLKGYILGGIIPVVSERNARFMDNEINGISIDPKLFDLYAGLGREEAEELAVTISSTIADNIYPFIDGYYLMTPFMRIGLMKKIIDYIHDI